LSGFGSLRASVKRFYTLGLKLKLWEELRGVTWTSSFFFSSVYPSEKWLLVVDALVKWQADASAIRRMMS